MSRVARLGAFIVVTLAVLAAGVFIIGSKEYLFQLPPTNSRRSSTMWRAWPKEPTCRWAGFTAEP